LQYVGRVDNQVKIRGFRIEPGEIEAVLKQHAGVREALVFAAEHELKGRHLIAAVIPENGHQLNPDELRSLVKRRLPDYMVPSVFTSVKEFPLTHHGKIDRQALALTEWSEPDAGQRFVAPRTPIEEAVAGIWAEVLGLDQVGVETDFFDLGGHSLMVTQILSRVRAIMDVDVPITSLLESPTVAAMAEYIEGEMIKEQAFD
jgi:acyl carrier protein